jgi:hypothetical protein
LCYGFDCGGIKIGEGNPNMIRCYLVVVGVDVATKTTMNVLVPDLIIMCIKLGDSNSSLSLVINIDRKTCVGSPRSTFTQLELVCSVSIVAIGMNLFLKKIIGGKKLWDMFFLFIMESSRALTNQYTQFATIY